MQAPQHVLEATADIMVAGHQRHLELCAAREAARLQSKTKKKPTAKHARNNRIQQ